MTSKALRAKSNLSQGWVNSVVLCGSPQMQAFRFKEQWCGKEELQNEKEEHVEGSGIN